MHPSLTVYPFLSEIPDDVLSAIDLDVLYIPTPTEHKLVQVLSQNLGKNIVVYRNDHVCTGVHLCRTLQAATLTCEQLEALNATERFFHQGKVVVAYEAPLKFS